jgi:ribosomal-protein-alanine N-acetyltransferase
MEQLFEQADGSEEQYTLEVRTSNRPAIQLYERFGFQPAGRRHGYYHDNREDALIMWRMAPRAVDRPADEAQSASA